MKRWLNGAAALAMLYATAAVAETWTNPDQSLSPGVVVEGGKYTHISTQTTTVIKTGPGLLHTVCVNTGAASATATIDDAASATTPTIAVIDASAKACYIYDIFFTVGLTVVTAAGNADITVSWH